MNKEKIKSVLNKLVESKKFKTVLYILCAIFILSFVFQAGMMVGFKRASFSRDWGNNYERNFGPRHDMMPRLLADDIRETPNAHGAIGKIIKVDYPNIVVLDKDQTEKVVIIKDDTNILERRGQVTKESLTLDKFIVVIGNPNVQGQIEAKLIRIMPSPEEMGVVSPVDINTKK